MDLNATLFGQMITFAIFVWFTMKFVWPMLEQTLDDRQKKIADGLTAAEKGNKLLNDAKEKKQVTLQEAKFKYEEIIKAANVEAQDIIEKAKESALSERKEIVATGHLEIEQSINKAKHDLQKKMADLVIAGAEKIIAREVSAKDHQDIIDEICKEVAC